MVVRGLHPRRPSHFLGYDVVSTMFRHLLSHHTVVTHTVAAAGVTTVTLLSHVLLVTPGTAVNDVMSRRATSNLPEGRRLEVPMATKA